MTRRLLKVLYVLPILALAILPMLAQQGSKDGQWRAYASETGSTGYSPLDQINRDNVKNLQVAWTWKFDNFGNTNTEVTPIMVNGVLYFPLSPSRTIIAADAGTGQTLWTQGRPPARFKLPTQTSGCGRRRIPEQPLRREPSLLPQVPRDR